LLGRLPIAAAQTVGQRCSGNIGLTSEGRRGQISADPQTLADIFEKTFHPPERAAECPREQTQVAFAFQQLIGRPTRIWTRDWLTPAMVRGIANARRD
jgi:hypothetical protein